MDRKESVPGRPRIRRPGWRNIRCQRVLAVVVVGVLASALAGCGASSSPGTAAGHRVGYHGPKWTELQPPVSPLARNSAGFVFEPQADEMLLSGGWSACGDMGLQYRDTWVYRAGRWTQLSSAGNGPGSMQFFSMADDPAAGQVIAVGVYSGCGISTAMDVWNGSAWAMAPPSLALPTPMLWSDLAYDQATGNLVLFGLAIPQASSNQPASEGPQTWSWNGSVWTQLTAATEPPPLQNASMAYDNATKQIVLFGGQVTDIAAGNGAGAVTNQTWVFAANNWRLLSPAQAPSPRLGASLAYDPKLGELVLFGGASASPTQISSLQVDGDTWVFGGGTWALAHPLVSPPGRFLAQMAFDPATGQLLLFGGSANRTSDLADLWALSAP